MTPSLILRDESIRQRALERIRMLRLDVDPPWGVWVAPAPKLRTLEQNSAYWRIVGKICAATGHGKHVVHALLRKQTWGVEIADVAGRTVEAIRSSAKAEKGDFSELIEAASELAAELGIAD